MKARNKKSAKKKPPAWELRLYIVNNSATSMQAAGNILSLCEQYLHGQYSLTIIDILKEPVVAQRDQILATPVLIRVSPGPRRALVGNLCNTEQVIAALGLPTQPQGTAPAFSSRSVHVGNA